MEQTNTLLNSIQQNMSLIASQAGVLVERLWLILTKQQVLLGIQEFLKGIFSIGVALGFAKWMEKIIKSRMASWDKRALIILFTLTSLGLIFWGAIVIVDSLPRLFNPEYYSLKEAVDMLQKVRK
jgi:hypothetical protein